MLKKLFALVLLALVAAQPSLAISGFDSLPSYAAGTTAKTATAAGTGPFFSICGSASRVIRVWRLSVSGTVATAAVYGDVVVKKTTGATSAGTPVALTKKPLDGVVASSASLVNYYTVLGTAGAGGAVIAARTAFFPITGTAANGPAQIVFDFFSPAAGPVVLRNTTECVEASFGTTTTNAPTLAVDVLWTEELR